MTRDQFIGREWLFDSILKFLNGGSSSRCRRAAASPKRILAVTGAAGSGKTRVCEEIQQATTTTTSDKQPRMSIEKSLVNKRCLGTIHLRKHQDSEYDRLRVEFARIIRNHYRSTTDSWSSTSSTFSSIDRLDLVDLSTCLDRYFSTTVSPLEHHHFIMIDNLDALTHRQARKFIAEILKRLPEWIKLVVTCQPDWLSSTRYLETISLDNNNSSNSRNDIDAFVRSRLPLNKSFDESCIVIVERSACNFEFVRHVADLVREDLVSVGELRAVKPGGLTGLYGFLLGKLHTHRRLVRFILALAALNPDRALDSLYVRKRLQLSSLLSSIPSSLQHLDLVFESVSRLLSPSLSKSRLLLVNSTLREWLLSGFRLDLEPAIASELLVYWQRLCRFSRFDWFRVGSQMKTSTPCIPLADIEFIDDFNHASESFSANQQQANPHISNNYARYLNRFRYFFSMSISSDYRRRVDRAMNVIFERNCEQRREVVDENSVDDSTESWTNHDDDRYVIVDNRDDETSWASSLDVKRKQKHGRGRWFLRLVCCWPF